MIQAFWEAKFDMWPGRAEAEEAERRRLAELAEQRKQALLKKQQEEAAEYEKACAEYETAYAAWKEQAEVAEKQRGEAVAQKLDALSAKEAEGAVAIEEKYNDLRRAVAAQKQDYQRKKQEASAALASLGLFQFAQKKAANATIAEMDEKIAQADARLREAEVDRNEEMRQLDAWVKKEQQRIRKECDAAYPIPAAPVKPSDPRSRVSFSPTQTANAGLKDAICSGMTPGRLYTITDLQTSIPALVDLSNARISSLVRQLVVDGRLLRTEDGCKAYFSLVD
jgi:hypothetical protein